MSRFHLSEKALFLGIDILSALAMKRGKRKLARFLARPQNKDVAAQFHEAMKRFKHLETMNPALRTREDREEMRRLLRFVCAVEHAALQY